MPYIVEKLQCKPPTSCKTPIERTPVEESSFDDRRFPQDDLRPIVGVLVGTLLGLCFWILLGLAVSFHKGLW